MRCMESDIHDLEQMVDEMLTYSRLKKGASTLKVSVSIWRR